jgi:hypothetical protein
VLLANAEAAMAETLNVFLLLALPMDALKLPNVPIMESSTNTYEQSPVVLMVDDSMLERRTATS